MPVAPTIMLRTSPSCPGTSMMLALWLLGSMSWAKPMSMVMPRSCSSLSLSVLVPVSAFVSQVLPWSTWPAVPMMTCFMVAPPPGRCRRARG